MGNVFEFKLQTPDLKTVDIDKTKAELSKDFAEFKRKVEETLTTVKSKIENSTTLSDAKKFLEDVPLYADPGKLTLTIGSTSLKAKDQVEYDQNVADINASLAEAKKETEAHLKTLEDKTAEVKTETKQETKELKTEVSASPVPTFENLTILQKAYADHPEFAEVVTPTREERKIARLGEKIQNAGSDRRRRNLSRRQQKAAEDLTQKRIETNLNVGSVAANSIVSEELEHQSRYFIDIQQALGQAKETNRVHYFDEHILIDTYHPLFINGANIKGTVRIERDKTQAKEFMEKGIQSDVDKQKLAEYYKYYPEDKKTFENKGGIWGSLVDGLVEHSNLPPQSANALKSAGKIGILIGMGVLGWTTIKKIFNIGGKNEKGDGRKRGLGAAAVLVGVPALTGQGVYKLLTSGDSKDAWEKIKQLGAKNGIDTGSLFSSTDKEVVYPALGNRLFGSMTLEDFSKYTTLDNGSYKLNTEGYKTYLTQKVTTTTTTEIEQTEYKNKLALLNKMIEQKKTDEITDAYAKAIKLQSADKSKTGEEHYKAYLEGQILTANILSTDKKLKVADQGKLNDYLVKEIVGNGKDPASINKEDLIKAGLLVEAAAIGAGTITATTGGTNTPTNSPATTQTTPNAPTPQTPEVVETPVKVTKAEVDKDPGKHHLHKNKNGKYVPDKGYEFVDSDDKTNLATRKETNLEKAQEWTKEKWEALKKNVSLTADKIQKFFKKLFEGKPDSKTVAELKKQVAAEKARLKELNAQLDQLEKLDATKRDLIVTEKEIGELRVMLEEDDIKMKKIEAMIDPKNRIEAGLTSSDPKLLKRLTEAQKEELTRADKKINYEFKFLSANDEARLQTYTNDKLYLQSCGEKTEIRCVAGKYYLDTFMVPFNDAESVVRMANLTNFMKINFANRATTNVDKPWIIANDGDIAFESQTSRDAAKNGDIKGVVFNTTVLDGEDNFSSTIKKMGGDVFESRKGEYAQYLNTLKNERQESIWVKKEGHGMLSEELSSIDKAFRAHLNVIKNGPLGRPERPDDYPDKKKDITDKNATLETTGGYLTLNSHGKKINMVPSTIVKGRYRVGYVNSAEADGQLKGDFLEIDFPTPLEAIKVANLINFYKAVYAGYGTSDKSFNISSVQGGLEFAEDGVLDLIDLNALGASTALNKYSKELNQKGLIVLCDWLNEMDDREEK